MSSKDDKFEVVQGHELRSGDIILSQVTREGAFMTSWGGTRVQRYRGAMCWHDSGLLSDYTGWRPDDRFREGNYFRVRTPRPEPETNEFGPVCP